MEKILILDFGSQTTQLIGRRIRELGYFAEIISGDKKLDKNSDLKEVKGIIFSGSPYSVYDHNAPKPDSMVYKLGVPILGICYGLQRLINDFGGSVIPIGKKEYGLSRIQYIKRENYDNNLFTGIKEGFNSWMSHGDSLKNIPSVFKITAVSENNHPAAVVWKDKQFFGIQFHPEVSHCENGDKILLNFAKIICGLKREWDVNLYYKRLYNEIREKAADKNILLLVSGGVDSTVVAAMLLKTLNPKLIHLMYINTGLMRKGETEEVTALLKRLGAENLYIIDSSEKFYNSLKGITDPEEKRKIIGDLFIKIQSEETSKLGIKNFLLAQGTLYTDLIESGKGVGEKAQVIKSHHNVRSPLIEEKRQKGLLIEPLSILYKDEVRNLGKKLGLSDDVIYRHPFPGPGLAVRILGEVTKGKCEILREADYIFIDELKKRGLYNDIWQAFAVLLPIHSVGVAGDTRKYGYVLALRAIISKDGMTASVYPFKPEELFDISVKITNNVKAIGRVVYDISSKPPATIEWE